MLRRSFPLLLLLAVLVSNRVAAAQPLRVGRIVIDAVPVYSAAEARQGRLYTLLNLLHIQTRAALLRRFLLFHEGEPFDPALLAETERNLRLFDFLESVSVTASAPHDGVVDVSVVTHDALTTVPNASFSNEGGIATYSADVTQLDLFGSGASINVLSEHGVKRNVAAVEVIHPAVFGPHWRLDTLWSKNSDGDEERIALDRPMDSYTAPWSAGFLAEHLLRTERIFAGGSVASRFGNDHRELSAFRSLVLRSAPNGSSSLIGGIDLSDDTFAPLPDRPHDVIPASRHFRFLEGGYEWTGVQYMKFNYIDRDLRDQDFNLGRFTTLRAAVSPALRGRALTFRLRAAAGAGHAFSERSFVTGQISASTRAPRDRNTIISFDGRSVVRFDTRFPQAFVTRARVDAGWQLDRDVQFLADGQSGLRAYPDFAFEGRRRIILNAEHRMFLGHELFQLLGPGVAVFVDSGQAGNGPLRGMKSDAGVGLRVGIARLNAALIRVDWAYAFNRSPHSRRGVVWSISTAQAF
ncbi:MAG: hypothetical protein JO093_05790 [Acidobacteria bacterium]|nr:hypothetical protein [Acidobacteriota bacterium]MBV9069243.1 hypothetical protein [Acidobacteriota bacterium]MBV9185110.1 hypothetical protein [Acidobacteriota bacterium]